MHDKRSKDKGKELWTTIRNKDEDDEVQGGGEKRMGERK